MKNILDILKNMDKDQLSNAIKQAQEYVKTDDGKALMEKLKGGSSSKELGIDEKNADSMLKQLEKNPDIAKKISDILGRKD